MAGGMRGGSRSRTLAARTAAPFEETDPTCPARHCWVADPVDGAAEKRPGLLLEWRRAPQGWEGRVTYAAQPRPGSWALVEEWLPASALAPM